jgi:hypothetical protein
MSAHKIRSLGELNVSLHLTSKSSFTPLPCRLVEHPSEPTISVQSLRPFKSCPQPYL